MPEENQRITREHLPGLLLARTIWERGPSLYFPPALKTATDQARACSLEMKTHCVELYRDAPELHEVVLASEALAACAARDARIAELEHRSGMYGLELANELSMMAQMLGERDPADELSLLLFRAVGALRMAAAPASVAQMPACKGADCGCTDGRSHSPECEAEHAAAIAGGAFVQQPTDATLDAAPVPEAKAQGVVIPPSPYMPGSQPTDFTDYELGEIHGRIAMWEEVKRLNAAPVQQVSAPNGWKHGLPPEGEICEARIPHHTADGRQMIWCEVEVIAHSIIKGAIYSWVKETGQDGSFYAPMMLSFRKLAAAPAAPAAAACKACKGTGRRPIGGRGRIFGLTNRCFECQPLTDEEVYGQVTAHE